MIRLRLLLWIALGMASAATQAQPGPELGRLFLALDRSASWQLLQEVELQFDTHHPQGLVRVGKDFFLSSVEILERTRRLDSDGASPDRTAGAGVGHLYKFAADGKLLDSIQLGEGARYHPGGIDFDGQWLWVSVAEYRPNSHSLVYRVNPQTLNSELVFEFSDHLGAIAHDRESQTLVAASWGSRRFYKWEKAEENSWSDPVMQTNRSHYVDLQDCQSLPEQEKKKKGDGFYCLGKAVSLFPGWKFYISLNLRTNMEPLPGKRA